VCDGLDHLVAVGAEEVRNEVVEELLVALFVPLLTLAFKLVLGRELGLYYSTKAQARAGNSEAIAVLLAAGSERAPRAEPEDV